jgi:hypothetical protein
MVQEYRLYRLRADGSIIESLEINAESDEDAINEAIRIDHAQIIEVWQLARLVARVDPRGTSE